MNLNEQLQQAYEAGRRQALNEQWMPDGTLHPYHVPGGSEKLDPLQDDPWFTPNPTAIPGYDLNPFGITPEEWEDARRDMDRARRKALRNLPWNQGLPENEWTEEPPPGWYQLIQNTI